MVHRCPNKPPVHPLQYPCKNSQQLSLTCTGTGVPAVSSGSTTPWGIWNRASRTLSCASRLQHTVDQRSVCTGKHSQRMRCPAQVRLCLTPASLIPQDWAAKGGFCAACCRSVRLVHLVALTELSVCCQRRWLAGPGMRTAEAMPLPAGTAQQHVISHRGRPGGSHLQGAASTPTGRKPEQAQHSRAAGASKHGKGG